MNTSSRPISATSTPAPAKETPAVRTVRFADGKQAKKAGDWAVKKYAAVFKKLAE